MTKTSVICILGAESRPPLMGNRYFVTAGRGRNLQCNCQVLKTFAASRRHSSAPGDKGKRFSQLRALEQAPASDKPSRDGGDAAYFTVARRCVWCRNAGQSGSPTDLRCRESGSKPCRQTESVPYKICAQKGKCSWLGTLVLPIVVFPSQPDISRIETARWASWTTRCCNWSILESWRKPSSQPSAMNHVPLSLPVFTLSYMTCRNDCEKCPHRSYGCPAQSGAFPSSPMKA